MGRDIWTLTSAAGDNTRTGCQRFHNISRKITDDSTMKVFVLLVTLASLAEGQHLWEVYVVSYGFTPGYETEDPVYVILHGDLGTSSPLQLEDPRERNPDNVRHDIFTLEEDIGSLVSIEVFKEGDDDW